MVNIHEKFLETGEAEALGVEERAGLETSQEGRELFEIQDVIRTMNKARGQADGLPAEALDRQWGSIQDRIGLSAAGEGRMSRFERVGAGLAMLRRSRWAYGVAAVLVGGILALTALPERPVARLAYAGGEVLVTHERATITLESAMHDRELVCNTRLQTMPAGGTVVDYRTGAEVCVAANTSAHVDEKRSLKLDSGHVWVEAPIKAGGFEVATPEALVRVTGTGFSFGVRHDTLGTEVTVARGSVEVASLDAGQGQTAPVGAGQAYTSAGGLTGQAGGQMGPPRWVTMLRSRAELARTGSPVISITLGADEQAEEP